METLLPAINDDDAVKAIRTFPTALRENRGLQDRLPNARAWYACPDDDGGWTFAPARWAGHRNMTAERYLAESATATDGQKIEKRLRQWFTPLEPDTPQHAELHRALAAFLAEFGKQPNRAVRVSLINAAQSPDDHDDLVELLGRVIRRLDPAQQARLRRALMKV